MTLTTIKNLLVRFATSNTTNITFDAPFIAVQIASIVANQMGHSYVKVMIINIILLLFAKAFFVFLPKLLSKSK